MNWLIINVFNGRKYLRDLENKGLDELGEIPVQEEKYGVEENFDYILAYLNERDKDFFRRLYI